MKDALIRAKHYTVLALRYTTAALFLIMAIVSLFDRSFLAAPVALLIAALLVPAVGDRVFGRIPADHRLKAQIASAFVFMMLLGGAAGADERNSAAYTETREIEAKTEEFDQNRAMILDSLDVLIESDNASNALRYAAQYAVVQDAGLAQRVARAKATYEAEQAVEREAELVDLAKEVPARATSKNVSIYSELADLDPENQVYEEKLAHYSRIQEQERVAAEQKRAAEREKVARMGPKPVPSAWDGSYPEVTRYLKAVARDPKSVKIDGCTNVARLDKEEAWLVGCEWRARNGFGGMNRESNWFVIKQERVVRMAGAGEYSMN